MAGYHQTIGFWGALWRRHWPVRPPVQGPALNAPFMDAKLEILLGGGGGCEACHGDSVRCLARDRRGGAPR